MAKYVLGEQFTQIAESAGTIVNISNIPAEISDSEESGTGILLFPRKLLGFNKKIYAARAPGYLGVAIVATISTGTCCGQSATSKIPSGDNTSTVPSGDNTSTIPSGDNTGTFTDEDVNDVFDDGLGVFTPEDVKDIFDDSDFTAPEDDLQDDINDVFDEEEGDCKQWQTQTQA